MVPDVQTCGMRYKSFIGKRLCGVIKKELHIDAVPDKPFLWLGFDEGSKLIEVLKAYVKSAEHKAMKGG